MKNEISLLAWRVDILKCQIAAKLDIACVPLDFVINSQRKIIIKFACFTEAIFKNIKYYNLKILI